MDWWEWNSIKLLWLFALLHLAYSQGCSDGDVQLQGGSNQLEGRVEICKNNTWGTICDYGWSNIDSRVVCRQLNHSAAGAMALFSAFFGQGTGPILLGYVACTGSETRLAECMSGSVTSCFHSRDAGVRCLMRTGCTHREIRLVNGTSVLDGRVEVCYDGVWGTVCSDFWNSADAAVVCRQLGYSSAGAIEATNSVYGQGSGPIVLDDVMCNGLEYNIFDCGNRGLEVHNCGHHEDAGVICVPGCRDGEIRLEGGANHTEGRVEICLRDEWGTVCDEMWNTTNAMIVCRNLGLGSIGVEALSGGSFGEGTGRIWLSNVQCTGSERTLINCRTDSGGVNSCTHAQDAAVRCPSGCTEGDVRLVEGTSMLEGRVEVCQNNVWGTICDDGWDANDAKVVCRQLGFATIGSISTFSAFFGQGSGPVLRRYVQCSGTEASLNDCSSSSPFCGHNEDAGVRCHTRTDCSNGEIRLAGSPNPLEGRVEVCYDGVWGTVCSDFWTGIDAAVVCRQLGNAGGIPQTNAAFGPGSTNQPILLDDVQCSGSEYRLFDCPNNGLEANNCNHNQDAGVTCTEGCSDGDIRLVDGTNHTEGRVEICFSEEWGTICDEMWDDSDAGVVCRQLGQGYIGAAVNETVFGEGDGLIWLHTIECIGNESSLTQCMVNSSVCSHAQDVGVRCSPGCLQDDIRLVRGNTPLEGRVEICQNNVWGTVCDDGWSNVDAKVVCRHLGHSAIGAIATYSASFGQGSGPILLNNVACAGTEARLQDCTSGVVRFCSHHEDAGVQCHLRDCQHGSTRLSGGSNPLEGRVEVCYDGVWGTTCSDFWSRHDAAVFCRQLGYSSSGATVWTNAFFGQGNGPILFDDVMCRGNELSILDCPHRGIEVSNCNHLRDAGVTCKAGCTEGEVRLSSGSTQLEGRIEICINNEWGTVCNQSWDVTDARIVCRQLRLSSTGVEVLNGTDFGEGTGRIWLDNVQCTGSEGTLINCTADSTGINSCTHAQDAGVRCQPGCTEGDIRLVEGSVELEGRVEVCRNNIWGIVCRSSWNALDARVVCRQLGFTTAGAIAVTSTTFGQGNLQMVLNNVQCTGTEARLIDCPSQTSSYCGNAVGVQCQVGTTCSNGDVRLVEGSNSLEGRVEICYDGVWGTVCSHFWSAADAAVVCRQLGYSSSGATQRLNAAFGQGSSSSPIFLDDVKCSGLELNLLDCANRGLEIHNCGHNQDAGVSCLPGCASGEVRLASGANFTEGRVEICLSNEWGTVCNQMWDNIDASVVCRQLGLGSTGAETATFGEGRGMIWLDNVNCMGNETSIENCTVDSSGVNACTHAQDAGVRCPPGCTEGDIRLLEGSSRLEGRVEICHDNIWGTVCDSGWNYVEARVVCRNLGYSVAGAAATTSASFGQGTGLVDRVVTCTGSENRLIDCPSRAPYSYCGHNRDAGVRCHTRTDCNEWDLRLVGSRNPLEGRVEVCYDGVWGTVCSDFWSRADAAVVCRQLGYSTEGALAVTNAGFGQGITSSPVILDDVRCTGLELKLLDCPRIEVDVSSNCGHNLDAGVVCMAGCKNNEIRLVNGSSYAEGRLEICLENEWGTVCDQTWNTTDARVVCRQLGLAYNESLTERDFGEGRGQIWLGNVQCTGNEKRLSDCTTSSSGMNSCSHAQDVGVRCSLGCTEGDVRLLEGTTALEGRVEICTDNVWGTVCDNGWDNTDAKVVCRQLGFSASGAVARRSALFGEGRVPIVLNSVQCIGNESRLLECRSGVIQHCSHSRDAGVQCHIQTTCSDGDLRLAGSSNPLEGRVEVCYDGVWGTVCSRLWSQADASTVCRQLGYKSTGGTPRINAAFGAGTGPILLDNIRCNGFENTLLDCSHDGIGVNRCGHYQDAGVTCFEGCTEGEVRLTGGANFTEGRVEICLNDEWGSVCSQMWDTTDAIVVCRQLQLASTNVELLNSASFGEGTGRIWLDNVQCTGNERKLINCTSSSNGVNSCTHAQDAAVRCPSGCTEGDVRLAEGTSSFEGRVEVCKSNAWGTVCRNSWDAADARVVCRQLGLTTTGALAITSSVYGQGYGVIALNNVACIGSETRLLNCSSGVVQHCSHSQDSGVRCRVPTGCLSGDIRLVGGRHPLEGRVEVCYNGIWGTVCHDFWDTTDALIVCRQLQNSTSISGATARTNAVFGQGTGPIFLDDVRCFGNESRILDCPSRGLESHNCVHSEDAGVQCLDGCVTGAIRLQGGTSSREGRVEVCISNEWGTVCDQMWDNADARVACRQLRMGLDGAEAVAGGSFGTGTGRIWLDFVECTGNERTLMECTANRFTSCSHAQDAGVRCPLGCTEGEIRLEEGTDEFEGRVEVCRNNTWGTVCDNGWDINEATVVCRQLGASLAGVSFTTGSSFGRGSGQHYLNNLQCVGDEERLVNCSSGLITSCSQTEEAGVRCHPRTGCVSGEVRLEGSDSPMSGRVTLCNDGVWGTVCTDSWSRTDAAVVCRQLGYSSAGAATSTFVQGIGPIVLTQVMCNGLESNLLECVNGGTTRSGFCTHAGVTCMPGCNEGEIRLLGGSNDNEGRVEICKNDEWGTVCDQMWDVNDASVVCRQLGLESATGVEALSGGRFGMGAGMILLNNVQCTGRERMLLNCEANSSRLNSCTHTQDAGVRCQAGCTEGDVRLLEGSTLLEGRIEICLNNVWGTVCDDGWSSIDAGIVCRQLGLSSAGATTVSAGTFGQGTGLIALSNVACRGEEMRLVDCPSGSVSCSHYEDVGIRCHRRSGKIMS